MTRSDVSMPSYLDLAEENMILDEARKRAQAESTKNLLELRDARIKCRCLELSCQALEQRNKVLASQASSGIQCGCKISDKQGRN